MLSYFRNKAGGLKDLIFFKHKTNVYAIASLPSQKFLIASSKDGLDFNADTLSPDLKKKYSQQLKHQTHLNNTYKDLIVGQSEYLYPSNIHIQDIIEVSNAKYIFFHYNYHAGKIETGCFKLDDSGAVSWRCTEPVWTSPKTWANKKLSFLGLCQCKGKIISYWLVNRAVYAVVYPKHKLDEKLTLRQNHKLHKAQQNPIISPNSDNPWEAFNTFNPAAFYADGEVHLLYRAQGHNYVSSVGYARSSDGVTISTRHNEPIFVSLTPGEIATHRTINLRYLSGGGYGGCEDPRVTVIDNRVYMTYVHFDGYSPPRAALTSIALKDFLNHDWLWTKPVFLSPPGVVNKSACILPEKIKGKFVIFHRVFPNILIDFVDDLEFGDQKYLTGQYKIAPRSPLWWDSRKIGAGAPPLKTSEGWLLIYQTVDDKDSGHYKVGAMLLDLQDPTKVLHRSRYPIIEPDHWYDNDGFKAGVVYPCGAVIMNHTLFIYYGSADSYVSVATANLDDFLQKLINQ